MNVKKGVFIVVFFIVGFFLFSYFLFEVVDFEGFVDSAGNYSYVFVPFLAIFGCNFITSAFFYPILFLMHSFGLNLFILALLAAFGGMLGDVLFMFFGKKMREHVGYKHKRIFSFFERHRESRFVFLFVFLYAAFFPASNELMIFALGYFKYPVRKVVLPILLGNFVYYCLLIWLGSGIFQAIF